MKEKKKCEFPNGITFRPDGIHEVDPCIYDEIERYENVTVIINKCRKCGHIDISWLRQENTRKVENDEDYC